MINNATFKLCEQKNLFLSSIYLRITVFVGFLTIINKLPQQQKKLLFFHYCVFFHFNHGDTLVSISACFNCLYILHFDWKSFYLLQISFLLFFSQPIISEYANKFSRKGIPSTRFAKYLAQLWPQHKLRVIYKYKKEKLMKKKTTNNYSNNNKTEFRDIIQY